MPEPQLDTPQAPPSLLSLPSEVLLRILEAVPLEDGLSHVSLACKQLHALCTAPALLSELDVRIRGTRSLARTRALLHFVLRHGEHARSLRLGISAIDEGADDDEVAALVPACLVACAARQTQHSGGLRQLIIREDTPLASAGCLPLLTALELLSLPGRSSGFRMQLDDSWRQLTALRSAHLSGRLTCEADGPFLPPSLTQLCIEGDLNDYSEDAELPRLDAKVLAGLPALRCFKLCCSAYAGDSLAALSHLTTITRLVLDRIEHAPPKEALEALAPSLRALEVHSVIVEEAALGEALQALTALECLALDLAEWEDASPSVPSAVALLPRLQRCSLTFYSTASAASLQGAWLPPLVALPCDSLRWLALPLQLAIASRPALAQAGRLHSLCLEVPFELDADAAQWAAFWRFVAEHPPLRCLLYEAGDDDFGSWVLLLLDALLQLQRRRPALEVRRLAAPAHRIESPPACWAELHA